MNPRCNGSGFLPRIFLFFLLISGNFPVFSDNPEPILNEIAQYLNRREYSSALELFNNLDPEDAESTEILIMRSSILNSAGKPAEARKIAEQIIASDPQNTEALMILADTAALRNNARERRTFLDRVLKIDPNHVRALIDLGNISLGSRSVRTAAGYFDRALAAEPDNGEALVGRALTYRVDGKQREAERMLNRAAYLYPDWSRPYHERARLYKGAGFLKDALEDLETAKNLEPDNYWIILDHALVLFEMNRKQEALEELTLAISMDPDNFIAYVYTAGIKDEFGDYEGAAQDYAKLGRLKPDYYFAFEGLGMLKMKDKKWAEARDAFLDAYKQAPKEYNYALLAAINWMRAGRQTDPKQFLAQVLRTAPRDSIEYSMLRLFHDLGGDMDVAVKIDNEKNPYKKAQMLFYLASYYDIRGNTTLANRYYSAVQELDAVGLIEWRLNEWILAERGLGIRTGQ